MLRRIQLILTCGTLGFVVCGVPFGEARASEHPLRRERILISDVPGGLALPGMSRRKSPADDSLDFLDRRSSLSGVMAPSAMPSTPFVPNAKAAAKMLEKLDQQKNWMFQNQVQDDSKGGKTDAEEALQVGDYDLTKAGKTKGSVQRYMEQGGDYSGGNTNNAANSGDDDLNGSKLTEADRRYSSPLDRDRLGRRSGGNPRDRGPGQPGNKERSGNLASRSAFDAMRPGAEESRLQGNFARDSAGNFMDRSIAQRDAEFRKMLEPIGASSSGASSLSRNPLGGVLDPVNLNPDLTQRSINPITPNLLPDVSRSVQPNVFGAVGGLNTAFSGPRPGGFLDGVIRPIGAASFTPPVIQVPKPAITPPQSAVLEIPRRPH